MVGSKQTKTRFARWCKVGVFALFVPIMMAGTCPMLTLTITNCPTEDVAVGSNVSIAYMTEYTGEGTVVVAGALVGMGTIGGAGIAVDDVGASPISVTPQAAADFTLTLTAGDGSLTSIATCSFTAAGCADNAECDDGNPCNGAETCVDAVCQAGTAVNCDAGFTCNAADGTCDCDDDASCDDGDACNGAETCGANGECVAGTDVVCDESDLCNPEVCDPTDGSCDATPVVCDDGFTCNDADGSCDCDDDAACDDGAFCTGAETCVDGECSSAGSPCNADQTCNEETDACEGGAACEDDADCEDDGLFCNGVDVCDVVAGTCVAADDPCAATNCGGDTPICQEGDDAAVCSCPPTETIDFTLGQDDLTGSTGDDTFSAPLEFNAANAQQVATMQIGDAANGLAGADVVNATFNDEAVTVIPTLSNIETLNLKTFGNGNPAAGVMTFNASGVTGVDTLNSSGSIDDLTVTGLAEHTNIGMLTINDAAVDLTVNFANANITMATDDVIDVTVGSTVGVITINPTGANGFETINVVSSGDGPNSIEQIDEGSNTPTAMNISGPAELQLKTIDNSIVDIDASGTSGGVTLGQGTTAATYVGFNTSDLNNLTGGTGDDVAIFGTTLTTADAADVTEFINLGDGDDVVQATFSAGFGTSLPIQNVEEVRMNVTAGGSVNFQSVAGLNMITLEADAGAQAVTLSGVAGTPTIHYRGTGTNANQAFDTMTFVGSSLAGTDTLTITGDNRAVAMTGGNLATVGGPIVGASIEIINITVADGPWTFGGLNFANGTTYNFTASGNLTLGTVAGTTITNSVNATGVVGDFSATFAGLADFAVVSLGGGNNTVSLAGSGGMSISLTGGANVDTITGSAQADTISSGAGADVVTPGNGIDNVNTGTGADTVSFVTIVAAANANNILDFTAGAGGDIVRLDATTFTDYSGGATVVIRAAGAITDAAGADNQVIVDTAAAIAGMDTSGGNGSNPIAIATDTGNIIFDADGNYGAATVVIGSIPAAQAASLVAGNFAIVP